MSARSAAAGTLGALALLALCTAPAVADGSDSGLALGPIAAIDGVKPGSGLELPVTFMNKGSAPLDRVWLTYSVTRGLSHTELPSNCLRYEIPAFDEAPSRSLASCAFTQSVKPGTVYTPGKQLTLKALDRALYDDVRVTVSKDDEVPEGASDPVRGTAPAVELVERPADSPPADAYDEDALNVSVTATNTADFGVTGSRLKGKVGDKVDLRVSYRNDGPAWVLRPLGTSVTHVLITLPEGTTATKVDGFCDPAGPGSYECGTSQSFVNEGAGDTYTFQLRVDKAVTDAKGSVRLGGDARPFDTNQANDKADIVLSATGGSASPTPGAPKPSSSPTPSDSPSPTDTATAPTPPAGTGNDNGPLGGSLASTGSSSTLPLAGTAIVAVAVGTGAVVLVRRRKTNRS
ncbi:hypothetical protein NGF19_21765 [Streptomyces sp. RY43-2]|uniref:Gram-positive cocci surface proteins LPxTG domain-containing protein n=1 Tax=Streptomyces macrolidinus TaxID=2952607 RepID=A0ABT0ZIG1_9ACTN|nr:hypothetical protein [Streptomyces macrolidinus]MCN9243378.1 hypothetical protein [Streptomyces macrolidinus]